jgi:hypothetical protein
VRFVHRLVRLFGWSVVVAMLLGVLWPERDDSPAPQAVAIGPLPEVAREHPAPGPPGPPAICRDCMLPVTLPPALSSLHLG